MSASAILEALRFYWMQFVERFHIVFDVISMPLDMFTWVEDILGDFIMLNPGSPFNPVFIGIIELLPDSVTVGTVIFGGLLGALVLIRIITILTDILPG